ncbi:hypothetical protein Dda_3760 [Drechslerella dactyloides]|uniref:Uncharacterized protein n=1 Tax=Drechslerella dactyloides TaxID=74499 RepID=A0AAD6IYJ7_DREDA|nr:hypothetical protein Dda_3760 [Drechslerella dactyloides]
MHVATDEAYDDIPSSFLGYINGYNETAQLTGMTLNITSNSTGEMYKVLYDFVRLTGAAEKRATILSQVSPDCTYLHPTQPLTWPGWTGDSVDTADVLVVVMVFDVVDHAGDPLCTQTNVFGNSPLQSLLIAGFQARKFAFVKLIGATAKRETILSHVSVTATYLQPIQPLTWPGWIGDGVATVAAVFVAVLKVVEGTTVDLCTQT